MQHDRLLTKLETYGIRGSVAQWFSSYLLGRLQFVQIRHFDEKGNANNVRSHCLPVRMGVPQGVVLAPLLFSLYINDIVLFLSEVYTTIYADDISLLTTCDYDAEYLSNNVLSVLFAWFSENKLSLSLEKTRYMLFHTRQRTVIFDDLKLNGNAMERCQSAEFLGLSLESTLSWNDHCQNLTKKLSCKAYMFRCLRSQISIDCLTTLYYAEVQSRIQYGILLWGSSSAVQGVFRAQKSIVRSMVGARRTDSCRPIFKDLGILPATCIYILEVACYVHKHRNDFSANADYHNYGTRNREKLHTWGHTLSVTSHGVMGMGTKIFNVLPMTVRQCTNYQTFRSILKRFLKDNCFYCIEEYFLTKNY